MSFVPSLPVDAGGRHILRLNPAAGRALIGPAKTTARDAEAVFAAGWSERDVHDAVLTVCLFNFMKGLLEGHGVKGSREIFAERGLAPK
jgi:hypothetical protein